VSGRLALLQLLADGQLHSGEELAAALSVSRAAVWKRLQQLDEWGIAVEARAGSGYRLEAPIDLLDPRRIEGFLPQATRDMLRILRCMSPCRPPVTGCSRPSRPRRDASTPASRNSRAPAAAGADGSGSRPSAPGSACR
jgi:biotin operon repressor BirA-like protein